MLPTQINLPADVAHTLGLSGTCLQVHRGWPRSSGQIGLELRDDEGALVPAQAIGPAPRLERIAAATAEHDPGSVAVLEGFGPFAGVLLQRRGADRRLPVLARCLGPEDELVVHRPERRAVIARRNRDGATIAYVRVLRTRRIAEAARSAARAAELVGSIPGVRIPTLLDIDPDRAILTHEALPGPGLRTEIHQPTTDTNVVTWGQRLGAVLRALHTQPTPPDLPVRSSAAEVDWVGTWVERVAGYDPALAERISRRHAEAATTLEATEAAPLGPVHADLHDGQVLLGDELGLLDWDTLATGEGVLDLANILAHLDLRVLVGEAQAPIADALAEGLLEGYRITAAQRARLTALSALLRVRLACQYVFRPPHPLATAALLNDR